MGKAEALDITPPIVPWLGVNTAYIRRIRDVKITGPDEIDPTVTRCTVEVED